MLRINICIWCLCLALIEHTLLTNKKDEEEKHSINNKTQQQRVIRRSQKIGILYTHAG
jgi:hypothetical protein